MQENLFFGIANQVIPKPACSATENSLKSDISLVATFDRIPLNKRITKVLIRLSVSLLLANPGGRFSGIEANVYNHVTQNTLAHLSKKCWKRASGISWCPASIVCDVCCFFLAYVKSVTTSLSPNSGNFCCLLITFANSSNPDQAWLSGFELFDTVAIADRSFWKIRGKFADDTLTACKNAQHAMIESKFVNTYCRANQEWQWHNILFTIVKH